MDSNSSSRSTTANQGGDGSTTVLASSSADYANPTTTATEAHSDGDNNTDEHPDEDPEEHLIHRIQALADDMLLYHKKSHGYAQKTNIDDLTRLFVELNRLFADRRADQSKNLQPTDDVSATGLTQAKQFAARIYSLWSRILASYREKRPAKRSHAMPRGLIRQLKTAADDRATVLREKRGQ